MAELFLIRGETLEAASDKIREKLGLEETNQFPPTDLPTKIEEVYDAGYEAGYEVGYEAGVLSTGEITSLARTTWRLNDNPTLNSEFTYNVGFISGGVTYSQLKVAKSGIYYSIEYDDTTAYATVDYQWRNNVGQNITFIDGADTNNTDLINWVRNNAELINNDGYYANSSVKNIDNYAYSNCSLITAVNFQSLISVGDSGFWSCKSLANIVVPTLATIGNNAFRNCSLLSSVTLSSVTSIGSSAFDSCTSLTSVTIGSSITTIGSSAFWGCTSLANIRFLGTQAQWSAVTKGSSWNKNIVATSVKCSDGTISL